MGGANSTLQTGKACLTLPKKSLGYRIPARHFSSRQSEFVIQQNCRLSACKANMEHQPSQAEGMNGEHQDKVERTDSGAQVDAEGNAKPGEAQVSESPATKDANILETSQKDAAEEARRKNYEQVRALVEEKHKDILAEYSSKESKNALKRKMASLVRQELVRQSKARQKMKRAKLAETEGKKSGRPERPEAEERKAMDQAAMSQLRKAAKVSVPNLMQTNPKIVVDMEFAQLMPRDLRRGLYHQISSTYGNNRGAWRPSLLMLVGMTPELQADFLERQSTADSWKEIGDFSMHSEPFEELFTPENAVYLSADATETLEEFDPSKAYIIGGLIDRNSKKGASQDKARTLKFPSAKLPMDEYFTRQNKTEGKKVLTVNQVCDIIRDHRGSGSWDYALDRQVPHRFNAATKEKLRAANIDVESAHDKTSNWRYVDEKPRTALVTGASSGIGLAWAKELRQRGWSVIMVSRDARRLDAAATEVRKVTPEGSSRPEATLEPLVFTTEADCTNWADVARLTLAVKTRVEGLDGIVLAAGTFKWDDDQLLQSDHSLLIRQNLSSKSLIAKGLLQVVHSDLRYRENEPAPAVEPEVDSSNESGNKPAPQPFFLQDPTGFMLVREEKKQEQSSSTEMHKAKPQNEKDDGFQRFVMVVGSDAGTPDFSQRVPDTEQEQGYITSMQAVRTWSTQLATLVKDVTDSVTIQLDEAPLLDSPLARSEFSRLKIDWGTIPNTQDYVHAKAEALFTNLQQKPCK